MADYLHRIAENEINEALLAKLASLTVGSSLIRSKKQ